MIAAQSQQCHAHSDELMPNDIVPYRQVLSISEKRKQKGTAFAMPTVIFIKSFLCHSVYSLILIEHLRMVLFLDLDVCEKFAHIGILEAEYVGIVL